MSGRPGIVCVGSLNMDVSLRVARHPRPGETVSGGNAAFSAGGKGFNQGVAAARYGASVAMVGAVGDDSFGRDLLRVGRAEGMDMEGVAVLSRQSTGIALIVVDGKGENTIVLSPGANGVFSESNLQGVEGQMRGASALLLQNEVPAGVVAAAMALARRQGLRIYYNPAPVVDGSLALCGRADVVIVNESEAARLADLEVHTAADAALAARRMRVHPGMTVMVTRGEEGVVCVDENGETRSLPSFSVSAVDSTAAGDTFVGAFAARQTDGFGLEDSLRYATAAAALSVTRPGAQTSIPTRAEVVSALKTLAPR